LISAVIFDLDGVLVSTDEYHYRAWKRLFDEKGIPFGREINEALRGVGRMESLEIVLKRAGRALSLSEKNEWASRKNGCYVEMLKSLRPDAVLPGAADLLVELKGRSVRIAVASSSKNAMSILEKIGLARAFDAVVTGEEISRSKPDPGIFLLAAEKLGIAPKCCAVVEDAQAGIEAAQAAGMKAVGVGAAASAPGIRCAAPDLAHIDIEKLLADPLDEPGDRRGCA
jgi:beta-phosphoglucomutase